MAYPYGLNRSGIKTFNGIAYLSYIPIDIENTPRGYRNHFTFLHDTIGAIIKSSLYEYIYFIRKDINYAGIDICFRLQVAPESNLCSKIIKDEHIERIFLWLAYKLEEYIKKPLVLNHQSKLLSYQTALSLDNKIIINKQASAYNINDVGVAPAGNDRPHYVRSAPYNYHTLLDFISIFIHFKRDTFTQKTYGWLNKQAFLDYDLRFADDSKFGRWLSLSELESAVDNIKLFIRMQGGTHLSVVREAFAAIITTSKEYNSLEKGASFLEANYSFEKCEDAFESFCSVFECHTPIKEVRSAWETFLVGMIHNLFTKRPPFFTYMLILRGDVELNTNTLTRYLLPSELRECCKETDHIPIDEMVSRKQFEKLIGTALFTLKLNNKSSLRDEILNLSHFDNINSYKHKGGVCTRRFSILSMLQSSERSFIPYSQHCNVIELLKIDRIALERINPDAIFTYGYHIWKRNKQIAPVSDTQTGLHIGLCEDAMRGVLDSINNNVSHVRPTSKEMVRTWNKFLENRAHAKKSLLKIIRQGLKKEDDFVIVLRMQELMLLLNITRNKWTSLLRYTRQEYNPICAITKTFTFLEKSHSNRMYFLRILRNKAEPFYDKLTKLQAKDDNYL